jgi:flagellar protein FliO/FliZ
MTDSLAAVPSGAGAIGQLLLSLAIIVLLIVVLAWLARRLRFAQRPAGGVLELQAELPLGPRERIVLLRIGDRQALVGVSAAGLCSLQPLEAPVATDTTVAGTPAGPGLLQLLGVRRPAG